MRAPLCAAALLITVLFGSEAHAQFANRSLGLSTGYMALNRVIPVDWGLPIALNATGYVEGGFEYVVYFPVMILVERVQNRQVVGIAPAAGFRYLLFEEAFRPFAGLNLSFLHVFGIQAEQNFVGLGPNLGFEFFVSDTISVGARGQANVYWWLNLPSPLTSLELHVTASAYY